MKEAKELYGSGIEVTHTSTHSISKESA